MRCSDRVFIKMAEFKALSYEELFQNVKAIEWQDFIDENGEFPISWVSSVKSKLYSKSDIQRISKKAIVEKLKEKYKRENIFRKWSTVLYKKFNVIKMYL